MTQQKSNLFAGVPESPSCEVFTTLLQSGHFKLERIVSAGQATPEGEWCAQDMAEWVLVLRGRAGLLFEDEPCERVLAAGDYVNIPARRRHRVAWTDRDEPTVWLALHYSG